MLKFCYALDVDSFFPWIMIMNFSQSFFYAHKSKDYPINQTQYSTAAYIRSYSPAKSHDTSKDYKVKQFPLDAVKSSKYVHNISNVVCKSKSTI